MDGADKITDVRLGQPLSSARWEGVSDSVQHIAKLLAELANKEEDGYVAVYRQYAFDLAVAALACKYVADDPDARERIRVAVVEPYRKEE